jgi:large subunit ribosomal protein L15
MRLNRLNPRPGSRQKRTRVGRGIGSGKGKTAGRGHKGQKARTGVRLKGFEGGQQPLHRRLPKRGFNVPFPVQWAELNLGRLQAAIDSGKIDANATIGQAELKAAGLIRGPSKAVKLLAKGELKSRIALEVSRASAAAIAAVEKAGGSIALSMPAKTDKADQSGETEAKSAPAAKKDTD